MATTLPALTADDIKAIRLADSWSIWIDGTIAKFTLTKKAERRKRGPFTTRSDDADYSIMCGIRSTQNAYFGELFRYGNLDAIALIVRPGDRLLWSARQNNNQYADACTIERGKLDGSSFDSYSALHLDELLLTVVRTGANGKERAIVHEMVFSHSFCPDNSARALRPTRKIEYSLTTD